MTPAPMPRSTQALPEYYIRTLQNRAIVVSHHPVAILYPFLQKHFVKGVNLGAMPRASATPTGLA